jgi:hypothetical protein
MICEWMAIKQKAINKANLNNHWLYKIRIVVIYNQQLVVKLKKIHNS